MPKYISLAAGLAALLLSAGASAASQCYAPEELQAEQLLRLHSELMVITVTCRQGSNGENLVPAYTGFTNTHIGILHEAEQTLMRFYRAHFGGDGTARLDKTRTRLANEFGQKIANQSAPAFCAQYRDKVLTFSAASADEVQNEVRRLTLAEKSYIRPCDVARMAKNGE